jgi:hypothetical protein
VINKEKLTYEKMEIPLQPPWTLCSSGERQKINVIYTYHLMISAMRKRKQGYGLGCI